MIDLRADWVAPPTEEMWEAMRNATDESVAEVECLAASILEKEAALWTPTCSMANLVALMTLAKAGERVVLEAQAHVLTTEGMGIEHVARLVPIAIPAPDGHLELAEVEAANAHLLCLENTHTRAGGTVLHVDETTRLAAAVGRVHLDGARLPNAAAALGVPMAALAAPVDTVAVSLSKGLCAPIGAVLAGEAAVIAKARQNLRRVGGASIHKAGLVAAAGIVALNSMIDRLRDDHCRARELAEGLAAIDGVTTNAPETNIVFFSARGWDARTLLDHLAKAGIYGYLRDDNRVRFVTHRLIDNTCVNQTLDVIEQTLHPSVA